MTEPDRDAYVEDLFSSIAPRYDLLNSVLSLGRHGAWRRFAVSRSGLRPGGRALDVCCGTGDFAFDLAKTVGESGRVVGVDFSRPMIGLARMKAKDRSPVPVEFLVANASGLPFADDSFDCVTVGFGLRNIADVPRAVREMARVTKPGGRVISLEIVGIRSPILRLAWRVYFWGMPRLAAGFFGARRSAYEYLPRSVGKFMSREELARVFEDTGLRDVEVHGLALGAVCVHIGTWSCY